MEEKRKKLVLNSRIVQSQDKGKLKKTKRIRRAEGTKFRLACVRLCRQIN